MENILMRIFKTKIFHYWARKINLKDEVLKKAIDEMFFGQYEASLGGYLYKKRVAIGNKGKRSGLRVIIVFKKEHHAFLIYGFSKNHRENIRDDEKEALKELAKIYLSYNNDQLNIGLKTKEFVEVQ